MPVFKQNPKNKYKAKTVKRDGVTYRSEAEADRNTDLRGLHRAGEVVAWFRQVKVRLADSVDYTADFLVISGKPGGITTVHLEDVKGVMTARFKVVVNMWPKHGPLPLSIIRNGRAVQILYPEVFVEKPEVGQ